LERVDLGNAWPLEKEMDPDLSAGETGSWVALTRESVVTVEVIVLFAETRPALALARARG